MRQLSKLHPEYWIKVTADTFFVTPDELTSSFGTKELQQYRLAAMWIAREMTGLPYPALARSFHKEDHTTIMNGVKRAQEDERIAGLVEEVFEYVESGEGESSF